MNIRISVAASDTDEELRSLYTWLRDEPAIRENCRISLDGRGIGPGEMGEILDVITLLVTSGLQLPALAQTLSGWAATRRNRPTVTVSRGDFQVVITGANIDEVLEVLDTLDVRDQG
uniref:effector-associated constant component EACC1 n=1 Tax=Herbidospora sakaeratensis TaxID=564415 RepID=UPI000AB4A885|nr:hypothetical protein [Herbidospora sakaeratensis]